MVQQELVLENENGLHMRPGTAFVQEAKKQPCKVTIINNEKSCDAKSLVQLLKLGIGKGQTVSIQCEGESEQESLNSLIQFIHTLKD